MTLQLQITKVRSKFRSFFCLFFVFRLYATVLQANQPPHFGKDTGYLGLHCLYHHHHHQEDKATNRYIGPEPNYMDSKPEHLKEDVLFFFFFFCLTLILFFNDKLQFCPCQGIFIGFLPADVFSGCTWVIIWRHEAFRMNYQFGHYFNTISMQLKFL